MNNKTNIQQLAKKLAVKKHMSQKSAETFLREFFDAIIQNVTAQKSVKVTGLGSFKLIEVQERESVDVNTGERIVIPGHTKLTFTPDGALKDMVNKPFADFQTVIINEGTDLGEMEKTPEEAPEVSDVSDVSETMDVPEDIDNIEAIDTSDTPEVPEVSEVSEVPEVSEVSGVLDAPSSGEESEIAEVSEEAPVSEPEEESEEAPAEPEPAAVPAAELKPAPKKVRTMTTPEKWALILGIILLCVLSYFVGYYRVFLPHSDSPVEETVDAGQTDFTDESFYFTEDSLDEASTLPEDTVPADTTVSADTASVAKEEKVALPQKAEPSQEEAIRPTLVRGKKYTITGTRKTRVMKRGDYLTKIALEEYGEREFAKYIIAHNHFPDPNNVPVGKEILIPELEEAK